MGLLSDLQTAFLLGSENQFRTLDHLSCATLNQLLKSSPPEAEMVLSMVKSNLSHAESQRHDLTSLATHVFKFAEYE